MEINQNKCSNIIQNAQINGIVSSSYTLENGQNKNIDYLFDYSKFLFKSKLDDDSILYWIIERIPLLKPLGLDVNALKEVILKLKFRK